MGTQSGQKIALWRYQESFSTEDDTRDFKSLSKYQKELLSSWLKGYQHNELGLLDALRSSETPVSDLGSKSPPLFEGLMIKVFLLLGIQPGFIAPASNHCSFQFLCLWLGLSFQQASRHGLFWLTSAQLKKPSMSFLIHHCYHWTAFKAGLTGYTPEAQSIYNKFWGQHQGFVSRSLLQVRGSLLRQLQAAIRRDIEALQLVSELALQRI